MTIEKATPNKEKAKSIYKMATATFAMAQEIDESKYPSNILKEYYDVIRQLVELLLLLKGHKAYGEGAHEALLALAYQEGILELSEHMLPNELRKVRNRVAYDGFFVDYEYLGRKKAGIKSLIGKLSKTAEKELRGFY